jgi:hypothetical protein
VVFQVLGDHWYDPNKKEKKERGSKKVETSPII